MSIAYLITFKPAGRFFFGTSQSFGEGFHAISSRFPTQTTLLGTIRAKILEQNHCLDMSTRRPIGDFKELTGTSAMRGLDETDTDLGKIERLSPVFLVKQTSTDISPNDFLFPAPADVFFEIDEDDINKPAKGLIRPNLQKVDDCLTHKGNFSYQYERKMKQPQADYLGGMEFWQAYGKKESLPFHNAYFAENIFISDSQPGIARETIAEKIRVARPEHFYRKEDFRLTGDYAFGVIVHFSEENVLKDDHVFTGGERSLFIMESHKLPMQTSHVFSEHPIISRFLSEKDKGDFYEDAGAGDYVLFSSFLAEGEIHADFAVIDRLYAPRSINNSRKKTNSFRAIPTGSILKFRENPGSVTAFPTVCKIGYNFAVKF